MPRPTEGRSLVELATYDEVLAHLKERLARRPLAQVSKALGFRSRASVSMFLLGKHKLSARAIGSLAGYLRLTPDEQSYLHLLVREARGEASPAVASEKANLRSPTHDARHLSQREFAAIANWYDLPLFTLLTTLKRLPPLDRLERRLRGKVGAAALLSSLTTWERLGFIRRKGKALEIDATAFFHAGDGAPSASVRRFHRAMLERAAEAIEEQDVAEREIGCALFTMDPARLPEAKAMLERFREEFRRTFMDHGAREVCQLGYQLFWHTDLKG